jgi:carboxynorspermidine decarboxylase
VFEKVEQNFSEYFNKIKWINLGGGHHITRTDYDINKLIDLLIYIKTKYNLKVFMEPGEAIVLNTGFFVSEVLDIIKNQVNIVILDCSAATHLPDILEMPYRPEIIGAGEPGELKHTYRLGGLSCLAGDVIGDYSFNQELKIGDKLVFTDMGHYTMVKTTTFNGVNLPNIYKFSLDNKIELVKNFGYQDYKSRI